MEGCLKPRYDGSEQAKNYTVQQPERLRQQPDRGTRNQIHEHREQEAKGGGRIQGMLEVDTHDGKSNEDA
jgi:hypothetical protein